MTTTAASSTRAPGGRTHGATRVDAAAPTRDHDVSATGRPPEPHPLWGRLDSPLATYYLLLGSIGALLGLGVVMVFSASSVTSYVNRGNLFADGLKQAQFAIMGLAAGFVASRLPVRTWRRMGLGVLVLGVFLLLLMQVPGFGQNVNGNTNWLKLGESVQIQPSELGKLGLILYGAHILAVKRRLLGDWRHAVVPLIFPAALVVMGLVLLGGDLGTTLVLTGIVFAMMWTSGLSGRLFGVVAGVGGAVLVSLAVTSSYRMDRILAVYGCTDATQKDCWQAMNGQYALADGGIWGLNLGASREKWGWLPEQQNDFIFAIIGEELGIIGTFTVLFLVCLIAFACYRVILQSDDMFTRVATAGVMGWFVVQAIINIGSVVGLLPIIGVPLPLVSAGGSALVTTLFGLGMVISFARNDPACRRALAGRPHVLRRSLSVLSPLRKRSR